MAFHRSRTPLLLLAQLAIGHLVCSSITDFPNQNIVSTPQTGHQFIRDKRIINGKAVSDNSFPWAVSLQVNLHYGFFAPFKTNYLHVCGGSLIHPEWIITAAHCFDIIFEPELWRVRLGTKYAHAGMWEILKDWLRKKYEKTSGKTLEPYYFVRRIFIHPNYTSKGLIHDIALVKLTEYIPYREMRDFRPIWLPETLDLKDWPKPNLDCTVVGWGCHGPFKPPVDQLHAVNLTTIKDSYCRLIFHNHGLDGHKICAGGLKLGKGLCTGDSGGALLCPGPNGKPTLAGISSSSQYFDPANYPSVYTRVPEYMRWIVSVIAEHKSEELRIVI